MANTCKDVREELLLPEFVVSVVPVLLRLVDTVPWGADRIGRICLVVQVNGHADEVGVGTDDGPQPGWLQVTVMLGAQVQRDRRADLRRSAGPPPVDFPRRNSPSAVLHDQRPWCTRADLIGDDERAQQPDAELADQVNRAAPVGLPDPVSQFRRCYRTGRWLTDTRSISSRVSPLPLSVISTVRAAGVAIYPDQRRRQLRLPPSPAASTVRLLIESWAFWIISLRKMSGSAYRFCASSRIRPSKMDLKVRSSTAPPRPPPEKSVRRQEGHCSTPLPEHIEIHVPPPSATILARPGHASAKSGRIP